MTPLLKRPQGATQGPDFKWLENSTTLLLIEDPQTKRTLSTHSGCCWISYSSTWSYVLHKIRDLVGHTEYHSKYTGDFIKKIERIQLEPDELNYITSLFTKALIKEVLGKVHWKLRTDLARECAKWAIISNEEVCLYPRTGLGISSFEAVSTKILVQIC